MWQHHEIDRSAEGSPNSWELPWPCTETLKTFVELNEQCLELLTERALLRASPAPPMLRELAGLWDQLDGAARRRAAACPYLLIDRPALQTPYRWRWWSSLVAKSRRAKRRVARPPSRCSIQGLLWSGRSKMTSVHEPYGRSFRKGAFGGNVKPRSNNQPKGVNCGQRNFSTSVDTLHPIRGFSLRGGCHCGNVP